MGLSENRNSGQVPCVCREHKSPVLVEDFTFSCVYIMADSVEDTAHFIRIFSSFISVVLNRSTFSFLYFSLIC